VIDDLWQIARDIWGEEPEHEPDWRELNPEKVCGQETTTYIYHCELGYEPEYSYCWNAKVHGFDKCWTHLTTEQKREFHARKTEKLGPDKVV
jgi:hypothetical protein